MLVTVTNEQNKKWLCFVLFYNLETSIKEKILSKWVHLLLHIQALNY